MIVKTIVSIVALLVAGFFGVLLGLLEQDIMHDGEIPDAEWEEEDGDLHER